MLKFIYEHFYKYDQILLLLNKYNLYSQKLNSMATFTSSLQDDLLKNLDETSKELKTPKNKIIEKALQSFLDEIQRAKYAESLKTKI